MAGAPRVQRLRAAAEDLTWTVADVGHRAVTAAGAAAHVDAVRAVRPSNRRRTERARAAADEILAANAEALGGAPWAAGRLIPTDGDVAVLEAGPVGGGSQALIKVAATGAAGVGMAAQQRVLDALHADNRLGEMRRLVPGVLAGGSYRGLTYLIEARLPGERLDAVLPDQATRTCALQSALDALSALHAGTSIDGIADATVRAGLVGEPIAVLAGAVGPLPALDRVALRLTTAFDDVDVALGRTHGDYWHGNILCTPGGHVTGIVDWEYSRADDVTALDVMNFLVTLRMRERREEYGTVVVNMLTDESWSDGEEELLERSAGPRVDREVGVANVALATWLRHVTDMLERRPDFGTHRLWMRRNVHAVLGTVG